MLFRSARLLDLPKASNLEALIVMSLPLQPDEAKALAKAPFPTVLLDTWAKGLPSVTVDDRHGGFVATQHLTDMGHRRIGFVGEPAENSFGFISSNRREEGYLRALIAAGIPHDPSLVRHAALDGLGTDVARLRDDLARLEKRLQSERMSRSVSVDKSVSPSATATPSADAPRE